MSVQGGGAEGAVTGLVVGNLTYLIVTVVLVSVYNITIPMTAAGPFADTASDLVTTWWAIGGLLGVVDVLTVVSIFRA